MTSLILLTIVFALLSINTIVNNWLDHKKLTKNIVNKITVSIVIIEAILRYYELPYTGLIVLYIAFISKIIYEEKIEKNIKYYITKYR